jgi:hypothetical protein
LKNWLSRRKEEWLNQQKGLEKEVNLEELNEIEAKGEMTPWMQDVITRQAGDIHASFQEILTTGIAGAEVRVSQ